MPKLFEFNPPPSTSKQDRDLKRAGAFDEINQIKKIKKKMMLISVMAFISMIFLWYPLHVMLFGELGVAGNFQYLANNFVVAFFKVLGSGNVDHVWVWIDTHYGFYGRSALAGLTGDQSWQPSGVSIAPWKVAAVFAPFLIAIMVPVSLVEPLTKHLNPTPNIFGDTRWAEERDIEEMSKKDLVGFDGKLFLVGKLKNKLIQMKETLSVLLLAPPGTGKTVAFIVPSTVMMDKSCQLLNDQKPELFFMTSGHRATLGPVFQIMWSAQDMPEGGWMTEEQVSLISPDLLDLDDNGEMIRDASGAIKVKPIIYPSWNPIGPSSIPAAGPKRDLYIERLAAVLAPDPNGGDKFWTSKARGALIGLVHYLVAKVEMSQSDHYPGISDDGIPRQWKGKECSFPLLVDWFTEAQGSVEEIESDDPMRELFKKAVQEAREMDEAYIEKHGFPILNRALSELTGLMNSPDKTRGSILTTLDEALSPFKNEAVRQRTCTSSFSFNELRGRPKSDAYEREQEKKEKAAQQGEIYHPRYKKDEWDPITIYISINAEDAKAFATITGIFVDSANAYLVANGPNAIDDRGNQLGPNDFFFLLDETPTLPKLSTVIEGPAVGRSKRVSYAIVGQDFAQIETRYSKSEVETMKSTTAMKVVLSQNNETAAKAITEMAGSMTYMKSSYTSKENSDPVTKFFSKKKEVISGSNWDRRKFIDTSFVMSMPADKHIVLVQNFMNRPILADTPKFFNEPEILKRVFNLRTGEGPKPALPMPATQLAGALVDSKRRSEERASRAVVEKTLKSPDSILILSPQNIQDFSFDPYKMSPAKELSSNWSFFPFVNVSVERPVPSPDTIEVASEFSEMKQALEGRNIYVFDKLDKEALIALGDSAGVKIEADLISCALDVEAIREFTKGLDQNDGPKFFAIGEERQLGLHLPDDPEQADHEHAMAYFAELATYILDQKLPNELPTTIV